MHMIRFAICDDDPVQLEALRAALTGAIPPEYSNNAPTLFNDPAELLYREGTGVNYDILLLDVMMPPYDGIDVARQINRISPATQVIFVSAFPELSLDAYAAEHLYFLKKPVDPARLKDAVARAVHHIESQRLSRFLLPLHRSVSRVFTVSEVLYFERRARATHIVTAESRFETTLRLPALEAALPNGAFARSHNSFLVNLAKVQTCSRTQLCIVNGDLLPVSNRWRDSFTAALARSL